MVLVLVYVRQLVQMDVKELVKVAKAVVKMDVKLPVGADVVRVAKGLVEKCAMMTALMAVIQAVQVYVVAPVWQLVQVGVEVLAQEVVAVVVLELVVGLVAMVVLEVVRVAPFSLYINSVQT